MTIGGLRGAVAFYLALNVSSEYKHLIITTTISLILFTVIGMGSATPLCIKCLHKTFPEDEIIVIQPDELDPLIEQDNKDKEDKLDSFKDEGAVSRKSVDKNKFFGGISKIEQFDQRWLQKIFRKDGWTYWQENELGGDIQISQQENLKRITENYGDLSPNRVTNIAQQERKNRKTDSNNRDLNDRALTPPNRKEAAKNANLSEDAKSGILRKESKSSTHT